MSQRTIIFSSPEDVLNFVRTVEKYPYDMDLESGRAVVDAKSLLGLMTPINITFFHNSKNSSPHLLYDEKFFPTRLIFF